VLGKSVLPLGGTHNPPLVALDGHQLLELGVCQSPQLLKLDARLGEGLDVSFL
jgi:hypothetical protein